MFDTLIEIAKLPITVPVKVAKTVVDTVDGVVNDD